MTDRSGCGLAELTILQVVDELSAGRGGEAGSAEILDEVDRRIGLGPDYAYPMVCDMVTPWVIPVTLLAMDGSPYDRIFAEPEPAEHAECRLSRAGELVVATEAGAVAPVPAGLVNGTWWRGGSQPPLDPFKVIAALRKLVDSPGLSDDELLQFAGRPISLTGSELTGDFDALARGERVTIREAPRITRTGAAVPPAPAEPPCPPVGRPVLGHAPGRSPKAAHLIIDAVPRHLSAPRLWNEIDAQIRPGAAAARFGPYLRLGQRRERRQLGNGLRDVGAGDRGHGSTLSCTARSGATGSGRVGRTAHGDGAHGGRAAGGHRPRGPPDPGAGSAQRPMRPAGPGHREDQRAGCQRRR